MARERDYRAEYAARKAKAAAAGETVFTRRQAEARRLGYSGLAELRARRRAGELTHADQAARAKREGGKYVDNLGGGRWTFTTGKRPDGLTDQDRARLQQTLDRAHRADANVTITATYQLPNGRTGTAQAGGSYGVRVQNFHDEGADAFDSISDELGDSYAGESMSGATITGLSLFFFGAETRAA